MSSLSVCLTYVVSYLLISCDRLWNISICMLIFVHILEHNGKEQFVSVLISFYSTRKYTISANLVNKVFMLWHLIKYNKQHCIGVAYWCSSSAKQPHMGEKERTLNGCKSFFKCINIHTSTTINFGMWPKKKLMY